MNIPDYGQFIEDYRLILLGLPLGANRKPAGESNGRGRGPGRPKALGFLDRLRVAQAHAEAMNRHAVHVRERARDRALLKLQDKFRELCRAKAAPHRIAEVSAAIDKIGRMTTVPIRPPETALPVIDAQVAKLFGITARMVEKCRGDRRLRPFVPHPVWIE